MKECAIFKILAALVRSKPSSFLRIPIETLFYLSLLVLQKPAKNFKKKFIREIQSTLSLSSDGACSFCDLISSSSIFLILQIHIEALKESFGCGRVQILSTPLTLGTILNNDAWI